MRQSSETGLILGIESSCDETAAAVVARALRRSPTSSPRRCPSTPTTAVSSPSSPPANTSATSSPSFAKPCPRANVAFADLDAIAVTEGPGLAGALLVGITYAKALTFGLDKPLIAVNHLEGHIHAVLMEARERSEAPMELPLLALVVSGGHTHLYLAKQQGSANTWTYRNVGRTVDDAAGEAYDKVAKLLGLGYPGGPWIDALAPHGNPRAVPFSFAQIKLAVHRGGQQESARNNRRPTLRLLLQRHQDRRPPLRRNPRHRDRIEARRTALAADPSISPKPADAVAKLCDQQTLDLIASFQCAVVGNLQRQTFAAAEALRSPQHRRLRRRRRQQRTPPPLQAEADRRGLPIAFPSLALSTDNAAMIAAAAWPKFLARDFASDDLGATPQLRLGSSKSHADNWRPYIS